MKQDIESIHTQILCTWRLCAYYMHVWNDRLIFNSSGTKFILSVCTDIYSHNCVGYSVAMVQLSPVQEVISPNPELDFGSSSQIFANLNLTSREPDFRSGSGSSRF
jgi:hypothetical protein